jgi:hypothetical protein
MQTDGRVQRFVLLLLYRGVSAQARAQVRLLDGVRGLMRGVGEGMKAVR